MLENLYIITLSGYAKYERQGRRGEGLREGKVLLRSAPVSYPEAILYFSYSCTIESGYEIRSPFTSQPCSKSYAKKRERVKGKGKRILNLIFS